MAFFFTLYFRAVHFKFQQRSELEEFLETHYIHVFVLSFSDSYSNIRACNSDSNVLLGPEQCPVPLLWTTVSDGLL